MDFFDAVRLLLRRWRVVAVGFVAVFAAAAAVIAVVPTNYQASGQVILLLPARSGGTVAPANPYLNLLPGLTVTASLLGTSMSTKDTHRSMVDSGFTSDYAIGVSPGGGPILEITAEDTDPQMAVKTRDEVIARLQTELGTIQSQVNAPSNQVMQARVNSAPTAAEPLPGSKIRALAGVCGLGLVLTLLAAVMVDKQRGGELVLKAGSSPARQSPGPADSTDPVLPSPLDRQRPRHPRRVAAARSSAQPSVWWDGSD